MVIGCVWVVVGASAWFVRSEPWLALLLLVLALVGSVVILRFRRAARDGQVSGGNL